MNSLLENNFLAGSVEEQSHFLIAKSDKENGFVLTWAEKTNNTITIEDHDLDNRVIDMIDAVMSRQLGK
jgi:hypothetical protein